MLFGWDFGTWLFFSLAVVFGMMIGTGVIITYIYIGTWYRDRRMYKELRLDPPTKFNKWVVNTKVYLLITAGHLFPIELMFAYLTTIVSSHYILALQYINYSYIVIVILHMIYFFLKLGAPFVRAARFALPFFVEIEKAQKESGLSPQEAGHAFRMFVWYLRNLPPPPSKEVITDVNKGEVTFEDLAQAQLNTEQPTDFPNHSE